MNEPVQTWHYGLMARHWAENNTTGPEIAYFQQQIEQYGQPALDAGCGTGRLLIPFLRAGLDVDGCDISADMLMYCQQAADRAGVSPRLYQQALHQLDLPRRYQTIVACGVIGVAVSRQQDFAALQRFHDYLLPGGMLILDGVPAYGDADLWPLWRRDARSHLPEPWPAEIGKIPLGEHEYELHYRLVAVEPLDQRTVSEMRMLLFKDGQLAADDTYTLQSTYYFRHEMQLLLEKAGFSDITVQGDYREETATADHGMLVYLARK